MIEIILKSIELQNFMGIKSKIIKFDPKATTILGRNGSGKTTINTAFRWLLFNKDAKDRKDFEVKTLDSNGKVKHGLEHRVTAILEVEGKELILSKIYKEIWRKKKGEENKVFSGHETLYYIDEVPMRKKEYDEFLDNLLPENTFKIITDPLYFSTQLHWTEQRQVLLEVTGEIDTNHVITANSMLEKLDMEGKSIEQYRKMVRERKKKLNQDLERIPVRIDEAERSCKQVDFSDIETRLEKSKEELRKLESEAPKNEALNELNKLRRNIDDLEADSMFKHKKLIKEKERALEELELEIKEKKTDLLKVQEKMKEIAEENQKLEQILIDLRKDWTKKNQEEFKADIETICPTCGQEIPEDTLQSKLEEMKKNFNSEKAEVLTFISDKGKSMSKKKHENEEELKVLNDKLKDLEEGVELFTKQHEKLLEKEVEYKEPAELKQLREKFDILERELAGETQADAELKKKERYEELKRDIKQLEEMAMQQEINKKAAKRISELKKEQKELAQKLAEIEKQEFLSEEFIKTKVKLMEERINEKFKYVSFRLFETQVNGGIDEVCKALVDGVPFQDANRAGQINAGIDIINTLTDHYKVAAPIFIDNRESITDVIETNSQIINLVVDPEAKQITVANEPTKEEEPQADLFGGLPTTLGQDKEKVNGIPISLKKEK